MKKSKLRKIIKEEIKRLNEGKYILSVQKKEFKFDIKRMLIKYNLNTSKNLIENLEEFDVINK